MIPLWDDSPDNERGREALSAKCTEHIAHQGHVCAVMHRESNDVNIFLNDRRRDHCWSLAKSGVDHLAPSISQDSSDEPKSTVMAVEADLGQEHSDWLVTHLSEGSDQVPKTDSRAVICSPMVTCAWAPCNSAGIMLTWSSAASAAIRRSASATARSSREALT